MFAYVMQVFKDPKYLIGARVVAKSLRDNKTKNKIVLMITDDIKIEDNFDLFDEIVTVPYINILAKPLRTQKQRDYYSWMDISPTKWNCLTLIQYEKIIFIDSDMVVLENIDHLFNLSAPAATFSSSFSEKYNDKGMRDPYTLNNGVVTPDEIYSGLNQSNSFTLIGALVVIHPNMEDYKRLVDFCLQTVKSKSLFGYSTCNSGIDEQLIAHLFLYGKEKRLWTHIHQKYNFIPWQHRWLAKDIKPSVLHFFGIKPWNMKRDEWPDLKTWWDVRDTLDL